MTEIDAQQLARKARRAPAPVDDPFIALFAAMEEINYRLLTLEVMHNEVIAEINHHNEWLNDFRGRHEILYKLPWYRFYIWLMPRMGLPHFPKREKLKGIRIRDTMPRLREK